MPDNDTGKRSRTGHVSYAKSHDTRAQILAAALAEASEHGLHKTSVSRIAARANTAVGSLNYHFGSRNELVHQMIEKLMGDLWSRLAAVDTTGGDFFDRHRAELLVYVKYVRANPAHIRLADEIKFLEPALYRQGVTNWIELLSAKLRAGIDDGSVRPMDESELRAQAHFLMGSRQFLEDLVSDVGHDEEVVDAYIRLVRSGLGT